MYFRCTDLLQGVVFSFLPKMNRSVKTICLFGAWGGAGGAVTSCLKLHEVFTKSDFTSALSVFFFFFLIVGIFLVSKWKGAF